MIIFIPIEIKIREFLPKLYLAYKILKYTNNEIIFGGQRFISYNIESFSNCLWFDKHTLYKRLEKRGIHKNNEIFVLDEEGPMSMAQEASKYHYKKNLTKLFKLILLWGIKDKIILNKSDYKKSVSVGHPKFDLVTDGKNIFKNEINYIKKKYKNFVFIPGHLSLRDNTNVNKTFYKSLLDGYSSKDRIIQQVLNRNIVEEKNYILFLKTIIKIAKSNPKTCFVFRHHPLEDINKLNAILKDKPKNLILDYKFSISPWIISCNYFLHAGCTSCLEAFAVKKKILFFHSKEISRLNRYNKLKLSNWNFTSQNKICNFFRNIEKRKYVTIKKPEDVVKNLTGKYKFYKEFIKLSKKIKFKDKSNIVYSQNKKNSKNIFLNLQKIIRAFLSEIKQKIFLKTFLINFLPERHMYSKDYANLKFKSIETEEINNFFKIQKKVNNDNIRINVKKISESVFHFSKIR